jgi:hypothetical protein
MEARFLTTAIRAVNSPLAAVSKSWREPVGVVAESAASQQGRAFSASQEAMPAISRSR